MSDVPFQYSFSEKGTVLIQDMSGWGGDPDGLDTVSREWLERANQDHIDGTVTIFGDQLMLGKDAQEEIAEEWSKDAKRASIDRIGYVSSGIEGRAVGANLDIECEIRMFSDPDAAIDWVGSA